MNAGPPPTEIDQSLKRLALLSKVCTLAEPEENVLGYSVEEFTVVPLFCAKAAIGNDVANNNKPNFIQYVLCFK